MRVFRMRGALSRIKDKFLGSGTDFNYGDLDEEDYLEIDAGKDIGTKKKIVVKPFIVEEFAHIKPALDALREGYTIALINIKSIKDKDIVELKRAVNKLKKTCDAIEGDIAGFGEDWIVVTPNFAEIYRTKQVEELEE